MRSLKLIIANFASQALNIGIGFGVVFICTRLLSVEDNGELRFIMTLLPLFMALSLPGYDSLILRGTSAGRPPVLRDVLRVRMLSAASGSIFILFGAWIFSDRITDTLMYFIIAAAVFLPFFETATGYRNYLLSTRLRKRGLELILINRCVAFILISVLFAGIYFSEVDRRLLFPAYLIGMSVPTLAICWGIARRQAKHPKQRSITPQFKPAAVTTVAGLIYTLGFSLDKLLVRDISAAELAKYAILIMIPLELARLLDTTVPLFYKKWFLQGAIRTRRFVINAVGSCAGIYAGFVGGFYFFSDKIFGNAYNYTLTSVALAGLVGVGLAFEYVYKHKIFADAGASAVFLYSVSNLIACILLFPLALAYFKVDGLLFAISIKQLFLPLMMPILVKRSMGR